MLNVENISKEYPSPRGSLPILSEISFSLARGEAASIMGPSGSGKSTLLYILGALEPASSGKVTLDGQNPFALTIRQLAVFRNRHIGFVFQAFNLVPVLTARENVELIMELQHASRKEISDRVTGLFGQIGLNDKLNSRPAQLSGGQQQRVAVARALASKPQVVLADEPTANLDSKSAGNLLDIMARLNQEENMTFIFSTHDQRVIERASRVITLVDGKIFSDTAGVPVTSTEAAEK